jgi:hypothetical protein
MPIAIAGFALVLILMACHIYWYAAGGGLGEVQTYYLPYGDAILRGIAPYTPFGDLRWEYPPLGLALMALPALASTDPGAYQVAYSSMAGAAALAGLAIVRMAARRLGGDADLATGVYALGLASVWSFVFERYDIFPAVLTAGALLLYLKGRTDWAMALLAVGTLLKLYPALLAVALLIPLLAGREYRRLFRSAAVFAASCAAIAAPFFLAQPEHFTTFISYHSDRGLQLESLAASALLMAEMAGLASTQTGMSYGSFNLEGAAPDMIASLLMPATAIAISACCLMFFLMAREEGCSAEFLKRAVPAAAFLLVLAFIVFNKVFSAQYMVWLVPLAAVFAVSQEKIPARALICFGCACLMTLPFSTIYDGFCAHDPAAVAYLFLRNAFVALTMVETARCMMRGSSLRRLLREASGLLHRSRAAEPR